MLKNQTHITLQFSGRLKGPATALALILMVNVGNQQLTGRLIKCFATAPTRIASSDVEDLLTLLSEGG